MSQLDDFEIRPPEQAGEDPQRRRDTWMLPATAAAVVVIVVALAIGVRLTTRREAGPTPQRATPAPATAVAPQSVPRGELGPAVDPIDLPPLDSTDPVVRDLVRRLSSRPELAAWLASDHLVRGLVWSIEHVADGQTPAGQLRSLKPSGAFQVQSRGGALTIDPRSYARYDGLADTVQSMDAASLARIYSLLKPRMRDAYRELGHPEADIDSATEGAIVHLLRTPVVDGNVELVQREGSYMFRDLALEGLSPAQKQLLRMGSRNVRIIEAQLRAVARELGVPQSRLPAADVK